MGMREILFRGKRIDNGDWAEGTPFQEYNNFWGEWLWLIQTKHPLTNVPYLHLEIARKTISQFTGLADKNGKKIFEGDILKGSWNTILIVFYDDVSASYRVKTPTGYERDPSYYGIDRLEVIGNIHDNPELLEGERKGDGE